MRRRSLAVQTLLASAAAAFGIWWSSPSAELRAAPDTPGVSWSPCYREFGLPFECGTVQVPLDHDGPGGAAISIALVQARRVGPGHTNRVALPQSGRSRRFWSRLPAGHRADHSASAPGPLRSHRLRSTRHCAEHGGALLREPAPVGPSLHAVPIPRDARRGSPVGGGRSVPRWSLRSTRGPDHRSHVDRRCRARSGPAASGGRRRAAHLRGLLGTARTWASRTRTSSPTSFVRSSSMACSTP